MRFGPIRAITWSAVATAAALLFPGSVLAHSGEFLLVAEPTTVAPGGTVSVRADLPTTGPLRLSLAGSGGSVREVGVVEETDEGHFETFVQIPVDLPSGRWALVAQSDDATIASTTLEVAGSPIGEEEDGHGGERDEEDPLLVPLPSGWQASRSGAPAPTPAAVDGRPPAVDLVPFAALGAAILAVGILLVRTRAERSSGGPSDPPR